MAQRGRELSGRGRVTNWDKQGDRRIPGQGGRMAQSYAGKCRTGDVGEASGNMAGSWGYPKSPRGSSPSPCESVFAQARGSRAGQVDSRRYSAPLLAAASLHSGVLS